MQKESQMYKIAPADRLASVSEYYFSKKLKEVAQMNAEGKDVMRNRRTYLSCRLYRKRYNRATPRRRNSLCRR